MKNFNHIVAFLQLLAIGGTLAHSEGVPRLMGRRGYISIEDLPALPDKLVKRVPSSDGTCGGPNAYTCGTTVNQCCSQYGWCGDTTDHCLTSNNCQPAFGKCTTSGGGGGTPPPPTGNGRCGAQGGNSGCPSGQCCSEAGYCGTTRDHCASPMCQIGFGTCDADSTPAGGSTSSVSRPKIGSVPYSDIFDCTVPGQIALTYDDGPDVYTDGMVNLLNSRNAKATFFITGINNGKGAIDTTPAWNAVIKKMHANGHQLASHTWSHADLSTLTETRRRDEMYKLEMAMRNIVGFFPTYMRPPYSSCNAACMATMADLGYHVTSFDLDTDDYNNVTPALIQVAKNNFALKVAPSNPARDAFLVIAHDIHQQTAQNLTGYMLDTLTAKGYRAVTVGQCLGDPVANWYRTPGATVSTPPASTPTGTCTFRVANFCATPLPTFNTVASCWAHVDNCYKQGSTCWATVTAYPAAEACGTYQGVCTVQEATCQACANAAGGVGTAACAYKAPAYPAS